jgi:protein-L-isoaspartate(D-aspartate) O-methyltransferase
MWKTSADEMIETIRSEAKYTASYTGRDKFSEHVMQAMREVDRKAFVPDNYANMAYDNGPLPIGHGQTISQPYIVALMTDLLDLTPESKVLEIGTGSGYQAAILSRVAKQVYTIERVSALAQAATQRLQELGYHNVEVRCDDGYFGWQDKAPFDAIIVTAAATHIPQSLVDQLQANGRMIIPVGLQYMPQQLVLVTKDQSGATQTKFILDVAFVPLISPASESHAEHENNDV